MSAASRIARVVSLKNAVQSTTTRSWVRRSASMTRLMPGRRDELGHLGRRRRQQDADAGRVVDHERVDRLDLVAGLLELRDEVGDGLVLGVQVEQYADVAELEGAVDDDDPLAELGGGRDGQVDGHGRATDAALRAEHGHDLAGLAARVRARPVRSPSAAAGGAPPCGWPSRARGCRPAGSRR